MSTPRTRVHVDRLVLDGIAPRDRAAVVTAFRAELARLLAAARTPPASHATPRVSVSTSSRADAASTGRAAAVAVHRAIAGGAR